MEPLSTAVLDDFLDPDELRIELSDGVGAADSARFDIAWTTTDDCDIHYTDPEGRNLRWDVHPNEYPRATGDKHFPPPPDATSDPNDVEDSCISVTEIELVARAVHKRWREAYECGSFKEINNAKNPP
jgi:hypothetical protein